MKYLTSLLLFVLLSTKVMAQQPDTVFISLGQDSNAFARPKFIDRFDYVFGVLTPASWLFKWDAASLVLRNTRSDIRIATSSYPEFAFALERKLSAGFSINAAYRLNSGFYLLDFNRDFSPQHRFLLETRWYYQMARRVRNGRSANNFSGNYLGLEFSHLRNKKEEQSGFGGTIYNGVSLRYGMQRRLLKYGYFDLSYGVGVYDYPGTPYNRGGRYFLADAKIEVGLALAAPKKREMPAAWCDALQCFREERKMWKIDMYQLLRFQNAEVIRGQLTAAYEQKLGSSPFSIEFTGQLKGQRATYTASNFSSLTRGWGVGAQVQGRYYYGLNKRMAAGKSGNNLSGGYLGLQTRAEHFKGNYYANSNPVVDGYEVERELELGLVWGVQYRMFHRGYIDFNIGSGISRQEYTYAGPGGVPTTTVNPLDLAILGALRIGWAF